MTARSMKKRVQQLEALHGAPDDWEGLWRRYRDIHRTERQKIPVHAREQVTRPSTLQEGWYELEDRVKLAQLGGEELDHYLSQFPPQDAAEQLEALRSVSWCFTHRLREASEDVTAYYADALRRLSEASYSGYASLDLSPSARKRLNRDVGKVGFDRLKLAVMRYEQQPETDEPAEFQLFELAGHDGDMRLLMRLDLSVEEIIKHRLEHLDTARHDGLALDG